MWKVWAEKVVATVAGAKNDNKCKQKTCFKPKYQYLSVNNYLQGLSKSCCACIADLVVVQLELFERRVHLQEINRKDTVRGAAKLARNA